MTSFGKRPSAAPAPDALPPQSFPARLLLPGGGVRQLMVTAIDPESALFLTAEPPPRDTLVTADIDEIGRVEGRAGAPDAGGFWVDFALDGPRRARFARHLRWLVRRERGEAAALRRHTRYEAGGRSVRLILSGGREQRCDLLDVSLSGAGLSASPKPGIGAPVALEGIKARVVRHFGEGFAIEFLTPLAPGDLDSLRG